MTEKLDLGECLSLDADNLPSAVYLSHVETPTKSKYGYLCFFNLKSDKLRFSAVAAQNASGLDQTHGTFETHSQTS